MKNRAGKRLFAVLIGMGLVLQASAGSILDWSASDSMSTASADINLALDAGTVQGLLRNYTPGSAIMSSTVDAGYTGQNMYGVVQVLNSGTAATTIDTAGGARMDQSTPGLWLGVDGNSPAADEAVRSIASLVWFDLDAAAGTDAISAMSLSVHSAGGVSDVTLRFAVQSDGNWYVSSENYDETTFDLDIFDLSYAGGNWAALTAADSSSTSLMAAGGLTYDVAGTTLDGITAVGVFEEGTTANTTARARMKLTTLTAEVIPEPATMGLFGVAGAAILFIRRRSM